VDLPPPDRATPLAMCNGDIKFKDVEFAYDSRKPALNGLTFNILELDVTVAHSQRCGTGAIDHSWLLTEQFQQATGQRPVGKFVSLLAYMVQLQGPLNFFGTFYRSILNLMSPLHIAKGVARGLSTTVGCSRNNSSRRSAFVP
jgi:ABC-type transport system involved in Fe-S cluster assembly fused permease/ATPase subunit